MAKWIPLPTTHVTGPVARFDQRDQQHSRAAVGALGETVQKRWTSESVDPFRRVFFPETRPRNSPLRSWLAIADGPVNPKATPVEDPAQMAAHIKDAAKFFGAHLVGVCDLKPEFVYSHRGLRIDHHKGRWGEPIELNHRFAISLGHEMDHHRLKFSPSFIDGAEVGFGYLESGKIAVTLACYIRELGYAAKAHFHMEEQVLHVPIAVQAGLGELARNNCLITPQFGPRLRLSTVTTDLPLTVDSPIDAGIQSFCEMCNKCATSCPAQCIPKGPKQVDDRGIERWVVDNDKCIVYWNVDRNKWNDCARCITVCPWNLPVSWYQRAFVRGVGKGALARRALLWLHDRLYGKKFNPPKRQGWLHYSRRTSAKGSPDGQIHPPTGPI